MFRTGRDRQHSSPIHYNYANIHFPVYLAGFSKTLSTVISRCPEHPFPKLSSLKLL